MDKNIEKHVAVMNHLVGLCPYERVGDELGAKMVSLATEHSYTKSAAMASGGEVSRQTMKNRIVKTPALELHPAVMEKKVVKELHIFADEDHAHLQKANKKKGKASKMIHLVTVTEGISESNEKRHKTIAPMHFVDETLQPQRLWESVEGYLDYTYDMSKVEKVYVHGDGGGWIKNGLGELLQMEHVMDGYHPEKRLKAISNKFPGRNVAHRLSQALREDDKARTDAILKSLYSIVEEEEQVKSITDFAIYLFGNWDSIVYRKKFNIPGSCTEAMVSHVLSERFSRDPIGWSTEGLGKLSKLRIYRKNGGEIKAADFKGKSSESYRAYAERFMEEALCGATDWSIFDGAPLVFNRAGGTQMLLHYYGETKNTLWS